MSKLDKMLREMEIERKYFPEYFQARNDKAHKTAPDTFVTGTQKKTARSKVSKQAQA